MEKPLLRAKAIIMNEDYTQVLVQCDTDESFYRFPGEVDQLNLEKPHIKPSFENY